QPSLAITREARCAVDDHGRKTPRPAGAAWWDGSQPGGGVRGFEQPARAADVGELVLFEDVDDGVGLKVTHEHRVRDLQILPPEPLCPIRVTGADQPHELLVCPDRPAILSLALRPRLLFPRDPSRRGEMPGDDLLKHAGGHDKRTVPGPLHNGL